MRQTVTLIYNQPYPDHYGIMGEEEAVLGVLESVRAVHRALNELGYSVVRLPLSPPMEQAQEKLRELKAGLIFNLFEGFDDCPETEAVVAQTLAELGLTYTGCPSDVLALALNKARTKAIMESVGIDTPRYQLLSPETLFLFDLSYPCIVKPDGEDASHGLTEDSVVFDFIQLERQVSKISQLFGGKALVEEYINGREFNITVWGIREPSTLPITEIVYSLPSDLPRILTFEAKWDKQSTYFKGTKPVCPADIGTELRNKIETIALTVFKVLNCSGYLRLDMRANSDECPSVIEVNPNPDISPGTGAARQAKATGMRYSQFIGKIVSLALERAELVPS
jgi:D-alanine-D-alanine ligase